MQDYSSDSNYMNKFKTRLYLLIILTGYYLILLILKLHETNTCASQIGTDKVQFWLSLIWNAASIAPFDFFQKIVCSI